MQIRLISILAPFCTSNLNRRSLVPTPWAKIQLQPQGEQRARARAGAGYATYQDPCSNANGGFRLPTSREPFESYDKLKRKIGCVGGGRQHGAISWIGREDGKGWVSLNFLLPGVLDVKRLRSSIGTELPAALGQECVCSFHSSEYGFPPWRCQYVCDSARERLRRVKGHGSWVLVGIKTALLVVLGLGSWALGLLGVGSTTVQHSTVQIDVCTVLYCTRACMMQTRMLVSVGRTRSFTTNLDASLAGAAARNLQPNWEVLRRR